jgi:UDP-glucuronate decarboxylase
VDGIIAMMETAPEITGPINLGNPGEFTMRELAEMVQSIIGSSVEIVNLPLPQDDPRQRQPIIDNAKKHLAWEPKVQLRDGLTKTIAYFDDLLRTMPNLSR